MTPDGYVFNKCALPREITIVITFVFVFGTVMYVAVKTAYTVVGI